MIQLRELNYLQNDNGLLSSKKQFDEREMLEMLRGKRVVLWVVVISGLEASSHSHLSNNYFQEGNKVYNRLEVEDAYWRALRTWSQWVDSHINASQTSLWVQCYFIEVKMQKQSNQNCNLE
ncbi:hypothetical protein POM88_036361 [Heracleum sosnowskyi]|uniref:Trichome birefringence-like C-terminal domain-containing protein n=1 Tax=Heracleum sosnowskyi TaxID=360622 RepID=A0AAD8HN72_9APIA|nr:hypothetical protein POM88_036361 [Heracleum sosnowskyi]